MTLKKLILVGILLLALALRVFELNKNPLYGDELTMVYDTYSILKTGQDQTGKFLPLNFEMGGGRPVGYGYASLPFVAFFGPTVLGIRTLSVLSGLGIVFLVYLLGCRLFNSKVGLIAAFLMAISPWSLALSRVGFETHFALFLTLLGTYLFLESKGKIVRLVLAAIFLGLATQSYSTYKLTVPLFVILLLWYKDWLKRKNIVKNKVKILTLLSTLSLFILLIIGQALFNSSETRFLSMNVFSKADLKEELVQKINLERSFVESPLGLIGIFHNKVLEYSRVLLNAYFDNLSWKFLFLKGDGNPRHNPAEFGEFYWVEIIFMGLGIFSLIRAKNEKKLVFVGGWILLTPLATTLLLETHALRNSFLLPPFILLSAYGLSEFLKFPKKFVFLVFLIWLVQIIFVLERIYFLAPQKHAGFWAADAKVVSQKAIAERKNFDLVFIDNKIDAVEFAYPVYAQIAPQEVIRQNRLPLKKFDNVLIANKLPVDAKGHILVMELKDLKLNIYEIQK
jgi:4-amino-4-deoxy-L-arabinose transferase-like glycosyltransferase